MPQVPMRRTEQSQDALARALTAELAPLGATSTTGAMLLALVNQETGNGHNLWNYNVGNITTADQSLDYWMTEKGAAKGLRFRAYESFDDGVRDFIRFVHGRSKLWDSTTTGDVGQFTSAIRSSGYNPELDVVEATPKMARLAKDALTRFSALPSGRPLTVSAGSNSDSGWGSGLILLGLLWLFGRSKRNG